MILDRRETQKIEILDGATLSASGTVTHSPVPADSFNKFIALVSADEDTTVYVQYSDDGTNFYTLTQSNGTARSFDVNNEKKAIPIKGTAEFIRLVISNDSSNDATVSLTLQGVV